MFECSAKLASSEFINPSWNLLNLPYVGNLQSSPDMEVPGWNNNFISKRFGTSESHRQPVFVDVYCGWNLENGNIENVCFYVFLEGIKKIRRRRAWHMYNVIYVFFFVQCSHKLRNWSIFIQPTEATGHAVTLVAKLNGRSFFLDACHDFHGHS